MITTAQTRYREAPLGVTLARAEGGGAKLKAKLAGMAIDLEFRSDNTFSLSIKGGPEPISTGGTFKTGFGGLVLTKTTVDGKPAAASELRVKSPDRATMELTLAGETVILKPR